MTQQESQGRLLRMWLLGGGGVILVMTIQGITGVYGDTTQDAARWVMGAILPCAGMIVGAVSVQQARDVAIVNPHAFRAARGWSLLYLTLVVLVVILRPLVPADTPIEMMDRANLFLAPLQGLVGTMLGRLFVSTPDEPAPEPIAKPDPA